MNIRKLVALGMVCFTLVACSEPITVEEEVDAKIELTEFEQGNYAFWLGINVPLNPELYVAGYVEYKINTDKLPVAKETDILIEGECKRNADYKWGYCQIISKSEIEKIKDSSVEIEYYAKDKELIAKKEVFLRDYLE